MDSKDKVLLGAAAIVAISIYGAAQFSAEPRYAIAVSSSGGVAWRLDRQTGALSYCTGLGCEAVENKAVGAAKPVDWLESQKQTGNSN